MAECSSKSDEYGRDDGGNTYPSLHAMLVCTNLSLLSLVIFGCLEDLVKYGWNVGRRIFFAGGGGKDLRHNHFHLLVVCGYFCWCKQLHGFLQIHLNFIFLFKMLAFFPAMFHFVDLTGILD